jgi:hypothetical protein
MAAGLGFKTFTTGEVLTAADTNGYLMQGVLVFASAAARDAAITSPQEGQCCYLKDTDAVLTYSGSAWVGFDDSNAIQNSIVDAKGDLVAASGADTPARLAVGNNGESLVADSAATTGLRYNSNYAAGKNTIINGDLQVWQRGTTFSVAGTSFTADRFRVVAAGATVSRQTFTPGSAPVAGYEGQFYFNQLNTANNQNYDTSIRVENARTYAGQTVTLSFWARSTAGAQPLNVAIFQSFGTGGSPSADVTATYVSGSGSPYTPTASWVRYTFTYSMPSVSGKTFGTNNDSYLNVRLFQYTTTATNTSIDIWGVQLEASPVATAFQTATGTFQGELAACQRYYYKVTNGATNCPVTTAFYYSGSSVNAFLQFPVTMRTSPSIDQVSGTDYFSFIRNGGADGFNSWTIDQVATTGIAIYNNTQASGTAGQAGYVFTGNASASLAFTSEL